MFSKRWTPEPYCTLVLVISLENNWLFILVINRVHRGNLCSTHYTRIDGKYTWLQIPCSTHYSQPAALAQCQAGWHSWSMFVGVRRVLPDTTKSDQGGSSVKVLGPGLVWLDFWAFWWRFHAIFSRVSKWINKSPLNYLSRALSQFICLIKGYSEKVVK